MRVAFSDGYGSFEVSGDDAAAVEDLRQRAVAFISDMRLRAEHERKRAAVFALQVEVAKLRSQWADLRYQIRVKEAQLMRNG